MALMTLEEINEELSWINSQLKTKSLSDGEKSKDNHNFSALIKRKNELLSMRAEVQNNKTGSAVKNVVFS